MVSTWLLGLQDSEFTKKSFLPTCIRRRETNSPGSVPSSPLFLCSWLTPVVHFPLFLTARTLALFRKAKWPLKNTHLPRLQLSRFSKNKRTNRNRMLRRGHTYLCEKWFVSLKFMFNWTSCVLSGSPTSGFLEGSWPWRRQSAGRALQKSFLQKGPSLLDMFLLSMALCPSPFLPPGLWTECLEPLCNQETTSHWRMAEN